MRRFSADFIYTLEGEPIKNGTVVTDDRGEILAITEDNSLLDSNIERFNGVITPGFVNTHCHLELSHLHKKIPKGTGLIPFIKNVIAKRDEKDEVVMKAMVKADEEMYNEGIVAVGDISNKSISADIKKNSKIKYHTFIEMLGFEKTRSKAILNEALSLKESFDTPVSITVHAPYSLSKALVKNLTKFCKGIDNKISIHNQETEEENDLYRYKEGAFIEFFKDMNINADDFTAQSKNSIQTIVPFLPENQHILLVHNIVTTLKDIYFVKRFDREISWCFCPNSNLYVENKLPAFEFFKKSEYPICIGTDSLASNNKLSVLSEMKVLQKHIKNISFEDLLMWGCLNGAKFLDLEAELGSIKIGKTPGLNLVSNCKEGRLTDKSTVKKLI